MWSKFKAAGNYLGGKRKLVPEIFKHIPPTSQAPVFIDAFMGGGSVSLFAKAKGYRVICNDIATRSVTIGKALIENSRYTISDDDLIRLLDPIKNSGFIKSTYCPKLFPSKTADFLDNAFGQLATFPEHKQYLLRQLLIKFIVSTRPFGHFSNAKRHVDRIEKGDKEAALSETGYHSQNIKMITHPLPWLQKFAREINNAVFDNGLVNEVHCSDVFDFIKSVKGDIIYFDPPYAETASYEETYNVLDNILLGKVQKPSVSPFSKKDAIEFHEKLYASSKHIKDWVISMGQTNSSKGISVEELLAIVKKYRPHAEAKQLTHRWAISGKKDGKSQENKEYIIYTYHA